MCFKTRLKIAIFGSFDMGGARFCCEEMPLDLFSVGRVAASEVKF